MVHFFSIFLALTLILSILRPPKVYANELALSQDSKSPGTIAIPITDPRDLNFKARSEILGERSRIVQSFPLLKGTYQPSEEVFGHLENKKPWWGYYGMYVYRQGRRSIEGPAKESRFILNPYLLVGADATNVGVVDVSTVTPDVLKKPGFPFVWPAKNLKWSPKESSAAVTYDVTAYEKSLKTFSKYVVNNNPHITKFSLIAYNARDFGFNYIYPDTAKGRNVQNRFKEKAPILIKQYIKVGTSCGYPGGCNNMSPLMPELDYMELKGGLPAVLPIKLWKQKPRSVDEKPDFTYTINFQ